MTKTNSNPASLSTAAIVLVCIIASIGFAFDIYELLMLPLIFRPACSELANISPGTPEFSNWLGVMFFLPAFLGGIFGLLGGYLTDRFGRRRVLTYSILLYAFSAFFAGYSTSMYMLLVLRCTTFIGVCIEFVAAIAWLAELFPDKRRKEMVLGWTQAFSSIGGLLVAFANSFALAWSSDLPAIQLPDFLSFLGTVAEPHAGWRYTLMSGLIPAIPLIVIRPFLPESPVWQQKRESGQLKRPSISELFAPNLLRTTVVTTVMFAASYGVAFGALQQIPQIVPGLKEVQAATVDLPVPQKKAYEQKAAANYTKSQEIGGLMGRVVLAVLAVIIVSRRNLLRLFVIPGTILAPFVFYSMWAGNNSTLITLGEDWKFTYLDGLIFLVGLVTVGQFSFWGNYLPRVFPLHLRGTGESFAANIGGRMIGTSMAWVTSTFAAMAWVPGETPAAKFAAVAGVVGMLMFTINLVFSFLLPEPDSLNIED
ncbi:MAG: MFS transporter [Planctomycetales bacterium]|nr:MFS transporter [Planctomycetales bacterium]